MVSYENSEPYHENDAQSAAEDIFSNIVLRPRRVDTPSLIQEVFDSLI